MRRCVGQIRYKFSNTQSRWMQHQNSSMSDATISTPARSILQQSNRSELDATIPVISTPSRWIKLANVKQRRYDEKLAKYRKTYGIEFEKAPVYIECFHKEFNHYAGMKYPKAEKVLLESEHWYNTKRKNDWFIIKSNGENPAFNDNFGYSWDDFRDCLDEKVVSNIMKNGKIRKPTVIQSRSFPAFSGNSHLVLASQSGSGKTIAYAAPIISQMIASKRENIDRLRHKAIILTPTKQLCEQTAVVFEALSVGTTIRCITRLKRDSKLNDQFDILICTPSQLVGYLSKCDQNIDQNFSHLVIDEADRLLDDSNVNIMTELFCRLPIKVDKVDNESMKAIFVSSVVTDQLRSSIESIVDNRDDIIAFVMSDDIHRIPPHVTQKFIRMRLIDKLIYLTDLIKKTSDRFSSDRTGIGQIIIFCSSVSSALELNLSLIDNGYFNAIICESKYPLPINASFDIGYARAKKLNDVHIIVCNDMAVRGIYFDLVNHVINYDMPTDLSTYLHRIAHVTRCGRSMKSAFVTSFVGKLSTELAIEAARLGRTLNIEVGMRSLVDNKHSKHQDRNSNKHDSIEK